MIAGTANPRSSVIDEAGRQIDNAVFRERLFELAGDRPPQNAVVRMMTRMQASLSARALRHKTHCGSPCEPGASSQHPRLGCRRVLVAIKNSTCFWGAVVSASRWPPARMTGLPRVNSIADLSALGLARDSYLGGNGEGDGPVAPTTVTALISGV